MKFKNKNITFLGNEYVINIANNKIAFTIFTITIKFVITDSIQD